MKYIFGIFWSYGWVWKERSEKTPTKLRVETFKSTYTGLIGYLQVVLNKICWKKSEIMDQKISKIEIGNQTKDAQYKHKIKQIRIQKSID